MENLLQRGSQVLLFAPVANPSGWSGGWFELTTFPQYDTQTGTIGGAICIVRDVTPRIQMESRLDDYRIASSRSTRIIDLIHAWTIRKPS